jgi:hypothetical protein
MRYHLVKIKTKAVLKSILLTFSFLIVVFILYVVLPLRIPLWLSYHFDGHRYDNQLNTPICYNVGPSPMPGESGGYTPYYDRQTCYCLGLETAKLYHIDTSYKSYCFGSVLNTNVKQIPR